MITVPAKKNSDAASPLSLAPKEEKPTLSFAQLLKGVDSHAKTLSAKEPLIQNGSLVLALGGESAPKNSKTVLPKESVETKKPQTKSDALALLLKGETSDTKALELNPIVTSNLSPKELKTLIADAKKYLKEQIEQSEGYKKSQTKELPTTLKGLMEIADRYGLNLKKITFEEIKAEVPTPQRVSHAKTALKEEPQTQTNQEVKARPQSDAKTQTISHAKTEIRPQIASEIKKESVSHAKAEATTPQTIQASATQDTQSKIAEIKTLPLFVQRELSTEQLIQTKQHKPQLKTPKERADETLSMLLKADRHETKTDRALHLTSDFSVASAKVIAPEATKQKEERGSLESLLRGESSNTSSEASKGTTPLLKADSLEVKMNEAKQMLSYLSRDIKQAIEDYKPPFTKVKVQLNPRNLGEVDLTVVQRGSNVHVNLSSNNAAINTLAMNLNELRTQLSNSGINNATFHFNSSQDSSNQHSQQQQHQQRQRANDEYSYFENEERGEELLSSLEIVVPRYV